MNAPLHVKQKFIAAPLTKELRKKHNKRSLTIRKGDTIKVLRGQFKKQTGKIVDVNLITTKVHVEGIQHIKRDGTKTYFPLHPSNLQIIDIATGDKKRIQLRGVKKHGTS